MKCWADFETSLPSDIIRAATTTPTTTATTTTTATDAVPTTTTCVSIVSIMCVFDDPSYVLEDAVAT